MTLNGRKWRVSLVGLVLVLHTRFYARMEAKMQYQNVTFTIATDLVWMRVLGYRFLLVGVGHRFWLVGLI